MISQFHGNSSLSKTNFSNCISNAGTGFVYSRLRLTTNVSFCNFENLEATEYIITSFSECPGNIERSNYINNSQKSAEYGLIFVLNERLDILDSSFQHNLKNVNVPLFYTDYGGQIYLIRSHVDNFTTIGFVDSSEMTTNSFINEIEFHITSPCEGKLILRNQDKSETFLINLKLISIISLYKSRG